MLGWRPDTTRHDALFTVISALGYDATGIGDNEFVEGAPFLASAVRLRRLPAVNANVRAPEIPDWDQIVPPYRIIRRGHMRIGIIGLADPASYALLGPEQRRRIHVAAPDTILSPLIQDIRKQADLMVVLSHAGFTANRELARLVPEIDLIIGSHGDRPIFSPFEEGRTLIVQAGRDGAFVGRLTLVLDRRNRIVEYQGLFDPVREDIPEDPGVRRILDDYQATLTRNRP